MLDTSTLQSFIRTTEDLNGLDGDDDKVIRLCVEHHFVGTTARFTVYSQHSHALLLAARFAKLKSATLMARNAVITKASPVCPYVPSFALGPVNVAAGTFDVVVTVPVVPECASDRRLLLELVAYGLQRYETVALFYHDADDVQAFLGRMLRLPGDKHFNFGRYLGKFSKLVASKFDELARTPDCLVDLAEHLNPALTAELTRLDVLYDRQLADAMNRGLSQTAAMNLVFG